ncbi:MAG: UvrD-helicase domain-containing protein [Candidatus Paceibacterota bacterium]|jgi:DNA helicase-2/ATP-dependent DNA helicase PcrA
MSYLIDLNERQRKAVEHQSGPLLIVAGAGAGKTKTIAARIVRLVQKGVAPEKILAITFTNKAAKEMRDRIEKALRSEKSLNRPISLASWPFVSTFHSLGVHILRENARTIGLNRHFGIFDRSDSKKSIRQAMEVVGINPKQFEPGRILEIISREKGNNLLADEYEAEIGNEYLPAIIAKVWRQYDKILAEEKALDFDDLLLRTVRLLKDQPEILEKYQNAWHYLLIDEYQDTNKIQYELAKFLAAKSKNICAVGDTDQLIYGWRGASIRNLMEFENDYPNTTVVLLEENYRSSKRILEVANRVIEKNRFRHEKKLFTQKPLGEKMGIYPAYDETDEANYLAGKAQSLIGAGNRPEEIAVLYRANFQSRAIEEAFLNEKIPYQVLGTRFFERKEIKDILAYIKASLSPDNLTDFKRAIESPRRGVGKVTLVKALSGMEEKLPAAARQKIGEFRNLLGEIKKQALGGKPSETIKFVLRISGIETQLKAGGEDEKERLENIRELASLAVKYDGLPPEEGMEKLLTDAALASDQDELQEHKPAVKLMTVHAAKGLEFDYVFITGLEDGLFPHEKLGEKEISEEESEEERRLFYVALTRARKKIFLSHASIRTIFGSRQVNLPSEFFADIDREHLEEEYNLKGTGKIIYL